MMVVIYDSLHDHIKALSSLIVMELGILRPVIFWEAGTGSTMIRFNDERLKTIRISDHANPRYKNRWNLRSDIEQSDYLEIDGGVGQFKKGVARFYYRWEDWKKMCDDIMAMALKLPYLEDIDTKTGERIPPLEGQPIANWRR